MSRSVIASDEGGPPELVYRGAVAEIWLRRPHVHNRIQVSDIWRLRELFAEVAGRSDLRVLAIRATGKTFSAGFDIGVLNGSSADRDMKDGPGGDFETMVDELEDLRLPTLAVLEGNVYGGAIDLALACDFRFGIDAMTLRMGAATLGIHYYGSGLRRYCSRLGVTNAKKLFFLAQPTSSDELLRMGFLDRVISREAMEAEVSATCATLVENAPLAISGMKRIINSIARSEFDADEARQSMIACEQSTDIREGVAAWTERRKPVFAGR